ncbi:MAG TPA: glycosyltransferase [Gammaproteobacteria bacterium]|nr:glycosyltransferase [Gammaproteobacteria bacterium]
MEGKAVHILWEGTQLATHSFAVVNREHCANLLEWDVADLTLVPYEMDQFAPDLGTKLARLMAHDVRKKGLNLKERNLRPHVWIRHTWPPKPKPPGRDRWVVMLPWEYSRLPVKHVETIKGAHEIWTPSSFSAKALVDSGVDAPVHVVPNGVDLAVFRPDGARYPLPDDKRFVFLYVGGTIYRKGIDLLLEAYTATFSKDDDVCLLIKDCGAKTLYRGQTAEEMIREHQSRRNAPAIVYLAEDLTHDQVAALYRHSDVLVSPYRGEGFSLPTLESMACGTPAIVTQGGATDDFVDAATGWQVPSRRVSVGTSIYGDELGGEGFLLEPDVRDLARLLRHVAQSREDVRAKGIRAAESAEDWSWRRATLALLRRIDALCGTETARAVETSVGGMEGQ